MKEVLIIGSGISGMTAAIQCASGGARVTMASPLPSERAQSVMAAGGINAALDHNGDGDTIDRHIEDTLKGGVYLAGEKAVRGLCEDAPGIIKWLEKIGTVFSLNKNGKENQRAFGGQSCKRTCYCGTSTGKQIVTALIMEVRRLEGKGLIHTLTGYHFHSGLIKDGRCYGAALYSQHDDEIVPFFANDVIMATGGQNALFGRTTGSTLCDGYAAGKLFMQGAELKNLEFIQYHPTAIKTMQKKMLVSEAARGEGGRLYYEEDGKRVYFMEDEYGENGNLMPRDIVSRSIYRTGKDVMLDVTFLGKEKIDRRIPEIRDLCMKYRGIDITKESIPVEPSVHFFMGGLAVDNDHRTNIEGLYAIGECASMYHGANRLGGNSLLAAIHSGRVAAAAICGAPENGEDTEASEGPAVEGPAESSASEMDGPAEDSASGIDGPVEEGLTESSASGMKAAFDDYINEQNEEIKKMRNTGSRFPAIYVRRLLAETMAGDLGIVREEEHLEDGLRDIDFYISSAQKLNFDASGDAYMNYSTLPILTLAKATLVSAKFRKESRGAHYRSDYPESSDDWLYATVISYDGGAFTARLDREGRYES